MQSSQARARFSATSDNDVAHVSTLSQRRRRKMEMKLKMKMKRMHQGFD